MTNLKQNNIPKLLRVQVVTLGCSKNRVDSEHLMRQIIASGMEIVPEGSNLELRGTDVVILNTCGFIKDAKEESIEAILEAVDAKSRGLISKVFVFGCLSQRYDNELRKEIPEVDGYFGSYDIAPLLKAIGATFNNTLLTQRLLTTPQHYAYLKISEGCDRSCSYCAIPMIRGEHISLPKEKLVEEASFLAERGVKELIVVAQDTTYYGIDLYQKRAIVELLSSLEQVKGIEWLRLHYSYPAAFPEELLEFMASSTKICPYLDIPLQHCSDKVLSAMRRSVDGKQTRVLVEKIRTKVPNIVLRTTMMVGHPGEGKREFEELLSFIREYRFERLGAFTYSEEEGTWGAENLKDTLSERVKQERYETLMEVQSGISLEYNVSRIGSCERVLVDSYSDGVFVTRSSKESPEVDGEILVGSFADDSIIGKFAEVTIKSANEYDLLGEFNI